MNELTDDQIKATWIKVCRDLSPGLISTAFARAIIAANDAQRQAQQKPVAWLTQFKGSDLFEQTEAHEKASNPDKWTDAFPVFNAAQPVQSAALDQQQSVYVPDTMDFACVSTPIAQPVLPKENA